MCSSKPRSQAPCHSANQVFDHGALIAFHAVERTAEGAGGGASHKRSISLPEVRRCFGVLGAGSPLRHGPLSADVILGEDGPVFIDVNPRLVEPQNAYLCGVDLVGSMRRSWPSAATRLAQPEGKTGMATHQMLLAVLGATQHGHGRRGVGAELFHAMSKSRDYLGSSEEPHPLGPRPAQHRPGGHGWGRHDGGAQDLVVVHRGQRLQLRAQPGGLAADIP